jgi:hypothetical protein
MSQANRYLGGFCSSQRIFPPQIIQVLLVMPPTILFAALPLEEGKHLGQGGAIVPHCPSTCASAASV